MATPRQIAANRRNALKSTGPRTPEGKARSRFNGLKHGITAESLVIPPLGESQADLDTLKNEYLANCAPTTFSEGAQVETMVRNEWRLRRLRRIERLHRQFRDAQLNRFREHGEEVSLAEAYDCALSAHRILRQKVRAADRKYNRAIADLYRLQLEPWPEDAGVDLDVPALDLAA